MLKERVVVELYDDCLPFSLGKPEEVYWLSRHMLKPVQKKALYYLHGRNVLIRQANMVYVDTEDMLRCLRAFSTLGMVYAVVPCSKLKYATPEQLDGLTFRNFGGEVDPQTGDFRFKCVYETVSGEQKVILNASDLASYESRELIS